MKLSLVASQSAVLGVFGFAAVLMATPAAGQIHHENMDHHLPTDPVDHPVTHHHDAGDPTMDHHFPHEVSTDPHHHLDTPHHDPDPHHDDSFQHHHLLDSMHHEDHHHSDGLHHHHVGHHGDADADGHIDRHDVAALLGSYGGAGDWSAGDFDGDGLVGLGDLSLLGQNYGATYDPAPAAPATAVPEPASWLLAAAAFSALAYSAWRKRHAQAA